MLQTVRGMGYEGLELSSLHFEGRLEEFKSLLEKSGFTVSSVYKFFDFGHQIDRNELERYIGDLSFLGAEKTLIVPGFFTENSDREKEFARMTEALALLCELAEPLGIMVTLEDFDDVNSPCSTANGLRRFMDAVPKLRFTLDTGNFRFSGEDVLRSYEILKDRLGHVHLKDRAAKQLTEGDRGPTAVDGVILYPAPAGGGYIPIGKCIRQTMSDGYDSWYSVEHFNAADVLKYIKQSAEYLRQF